MQSTHFTRHHDEIRRSKSTFHDSHHQCPSSRLVYHSASYQASTYSPQQNRSTDHMTYCRSSSSTANGVHHRSGHHHHHATPYQARTPVQALQYYPDQPVYAHPNSYPPQPSSTRGGPLEYRDPNQHHHHSSGCRRSSHPEPMPGANFPRRCHSDNEPTNYHHHSSRHQSSSHPPHHSYGESSHSNHGY